MACSAWPTLQLCGLAPVSSTSNSEAGSCTRTNVSRSGSILPCTSARCGERVASSR
ncbi:Uncharacterised protein [Bordetella pertussis]|nr:Uncharacterised protein [Bordetella pertussis]